MRRGEQAGQLPDLTCCLQAATGVAGTKLHTRQAPSFVCRKRAQRLCRDYTASGSIDRAWPWATPSPEGPAQACKRKECCQPGDGMVRNIRLRTVLESLVQTAASKALASQQRQHLPTRFASTSCSQFLRARANPQAGRALQVFSWNKRSLLNATSTGPMHHPSTSPSTACTEMSMVGNYWTDADAALLGGNSFLASVFQDGSAPSSMGHLMQHFPDLEDDDQTDMTCCDIDGRRNADFLTIGDFSHICMSPADGVTSSYGDLLRMEGADAAGTNLVVSPDPSSHSYACHDSADIQFEAQGRRFDAALRLESASQSNSSLLEYGEASHNTQQADGGPASLSPEAAPVWPTSTALFSSQQQGQALFSTPPSTLTPSRSPVFTTVSSSKTLTGDTAPLMVPGDSPGTVSSRSAHGWRQPVVEMSGFVDLSDFLSPRQATPMQLSAEQLASLGVDTTPGHSLMASTSEAAKRRASNSFGMPENEEQQLRDFPVTFVSVRQDQLKLDPAKSRLPGHNYMASSNLASFLTPAVEQQLLRNAKGPWKAAIPSCFSSPKVQPDQANVASTPAPSEPERMPVDALAPVTPEKPRKRRPSLHRQQEDQKPQVGSSTDRTFISNGEGVPAKSSGARKRQKTVAMVEQNSAFDHEQVGMLHSHLLGTVLGGNAGNIVFPAQKDVLSCKAGDHVARERRRRDLMNTRYQTLESLLPKLPCRRDRFGIVEDTKLYVKEMELKLSDLKKTKEEGEARLEAGKVTVEKCQQQGNKKTAVAASATAAKLSPLNGTSVPELSISNNLNVEVVIDQHDQEQDIVIFVRCRSSSGAKLISSLLRALEKLQLDVSQCSTSKASQIYFCSAVCKLKRHVLKRTLSREKMIHEMVTTLRPSLKLEEGSTKPKEAC